VYHHVPAVSLGAPIVPAPLMQQSGASHAPSGSEPPCLVATEISSQLHSVVPLHAAPALMPDHSTRSISSAIPESGQCCAPQASNVLGCVKLMPAGFAVEALNIHSGTTVQPHDAANSLSHAPDVAPPQQLAGDPVACNLMMQLDASSGTPQAWPPTAGGLDYLLVQLTYMMLPMSAC
jgi:hypothetical protein